MSPHICHINLAKGFRGGERQTLLLIRSLSEKVPQTVVVRKGAQLGHALQGIPNVRVMTIGKPFLANLPRLTSFSLIHAHEAHGAHLAFVAKTLFRIPYIITRRVMKTPKNSFFFKKVYTGASRVVAISSQVEHLLRQIDDRMDLTIIPDSFARLKVDPQTVETLKEKYRGKFLIGHVGALVHKDKGQLHIIDAAKTLSTTHPGIHFLFVGDGKDRAVFEKAAQGYENIEFTGFKENVGDYFSIFDLFLFPSLYEGLGSSILDAFDFELPVIATRVGGIPDVIENGRNGILIQPGDDTQIRDRVIELFENKALCNTLGKNAKQSLERFDITHTTDQYYQVYKASIPRNRTRCAP